MVSSLTIVARRVLLYTPKVLLPKSFSSMRCVFVSRQRHLKVTANDLLCPLKLRPWPILHRLLNLKTKKAEHMKAVLVTMRHFILLLVPVTIRFAQVAHPEVNLTQAV